MQRRLLSGFALICVAVACGEATLTSSSQSKVSDKQSGDVQSVQSKTLRSKSSSESTIVKPSSQQAFSVSQPFELAQFGTNTIEVSIQGNTPSGSVELQNTTLAGYKVEYLNSASEALAGPIPLDADAKASFKLKLTSELNESGGTVKAPGAVGGQIVLQATDAGQPLTGAISFKHSNVALVPMNVMRVQDLPARFEFPAGTVPVFVNPADRAVVQVMHFGGGGSGAAQFKHQAIGGQMPAGRGYCPLNDGTTTVQVDPAQPLPAECLPCPVDGASDAEGIFYDHNRENSGVQRRIVCLKK